ncbi:MAG TPA: 2-amino-4-hydroxy-6-hydroxymethyldihydropteridine diphosphokinase [Gammaproteobacteria bacterium]|nr:2-amino-4-hydroxy-6-hydroxymethyldihydropteridine diphosphokinase [Gammaproteobacteria bacterium]
MNTATAYLALGSNLNHPDQQLRTARTHIANLPATQIIAQSPCYQNPPMGPQDQDDFVNQVLMIHTELEVKALLQQLQDIEVRMGRERIIHWGPRIIDIDLLLYDDLVYQDEALTLPHPGIYDRLFFIQPLHDIAPDLSLPDGQSVAQLLTLAQATQPILTALIEE